MIVDQDERNAERLRAWRKRYFDRFGRFPAGDLRQHRRVCILDDYQRITRGKGTGPGTGKKVRLSVYQQRTTAQFSDL